MQALDGERLLLVLDDHLVDAAGVGLAGPAVADRRTGECLQLERDVLENVPHPRPTPKPLEEAAALADRAAVLDHARQPGHEPVVEAGERVGGEFLEPADVDPGFEAGETGPLVGATQNLERLDLHVRA